MTTTTTPTLQYMTTQAAHAEHTDALSRDSGVSSAQLMHSYADEELPTDLSMQQQQQPQPEPEPEQPQQQMIYYQQQQPSLVELQPTAAAGLTINPALLEAASMARRDHDNVQLETEQQQQQDEEEDDVKAAALQMMQLRRGHATTPTLTHTHTPTPMSMSMSVPIATPMPQQPTLHVSDLAANYDDTDEANVLIDHFKRGDLARHGLHKGYAPVPKYE